MEIDTVIGKKDKSAESVQTSMFELISGAGDLFSRVFKSITADNRTEFADLAALETSTNCKVYFAHPYSSSERGTNEQHNSLIRRFIPKGKCISDYSVEAILNVQNWSNTLPRKILNYLTPDEAFEDQLRTIIYN